MKKQHYISWLCGRFRNVFLYLLLLFSVFTVLSFFEDTTLVHSYNKKVSVFFEMMNRSTKIPTFRNITLKSRKTIKPGPIDVPRLNRTFQHRERKILSMRNFRYPLNVNLSYLVNRKMLDDTPIDIKPINPHNFRYLHKPEKCQFSGPKDTVKLLVLVKSAVRNLDLRKGIRDSWGKDPSPNIRIVFLLGNTDGANQKLIREESKKYSDVVQEDFRDRYINNTYKTIMGFNWGVTFCSNASFFFFVDDDHYVFLSNIYNYLTGVHSSESVHLLTGYLLPHSKPYRDVKSKWFVSWEDYGYDSWPPYLAGGAYIVSFSTAQKFQIAFPYVKYLGIDDSYLGIVAKKLNIRPTHNHYFGNRASFYNGKQIRRSNMFASHGFKDPNKMMKVWNMLNANNTSGTQ
ncbi:beta-1,3-galactosyltransferase brn-like [Ylistrum balloti]|uniref:beta-1,3-galactosyltransferase brn-like n=1 Tax=Ylistrum balloti TaxID=509963 RepID=UPI002905E250|nr:beta-1,3-galactosyltransferase brn-like [Ylistrum balloti]